MTRRRWLPAAGIGLAVVTVSVLGALALARDAMSDRRDDLEEDAAALGLQVDSVLERGITEMERLAVLANEPATFLVEAQTRVEEIERLDAVSLARRNGDALVVDTVLPGDLGHLVDGDDLAQVDGLSLLVDLLLSEADAVAGAPFTDDGHQLVTVAAPVVDDVAAPEAERRGSVSGAVLGAVDVGDLLAAFHGDVHLVAPNRQVIGDGSVGSDPRRVVIDVRGQTWQMVYGADTSTWPLSASLSIAIGVVLGAIAAGSYQVEASRRRRAEEQAQARSRQLERIADAGARLQQSLDLGELLPGFAVSLANDFELRAVTIALMDDDGRFVDAFTTGPHGDSPAVAFPLRRGWRTVGELRVRSGRPLDTAELTSMQALADLLAVAMSNAQLYEREQLNTARLRELDALKNAFLGTVSHELRTSMTAIMGFGELLADSWDNLDDSRRREMANRIRRSAGSLRQLVDDLLDFARLEQERLRVSPRSVDLAGVVRQTVEGLMPLIGKHELDLRLPDHVTAWADPVAIERILANLVSNAAKYSPEGTTITVEAFAIDGAARLVVADQGPGIPLDERRRIFVRFYRLDTPESVRTRGAGIGLAILRDFADRSGASVSVDDAPGGGARFTVDFPAHPIEAPGEGENLVVAK